MEEIEVKVVLPPLYRGEGTGKFYTVGILRQQFFGPGDRKAIGIDLPDTLNFILGHAVVNRREGAFLKIFDVTYLHYIAVFGIQVGIAA